VSCSRGTVLNQVARKQRLSLTLRAAGYIYIG
jgi:hypothetical protein